jgi:hypothetical protein
LEPCGTTRTESGYIWHRHYAVPGKQWPCGISVGCTPGLLLGLAGIGYFYLRLYRPSIPSILLAQRERLVVDP